MVFEFQTTTTDATTNSAIGSIMATTFYDVNDNAPTSKQQMLNSAYSVESKMSNDLVHGIECDPKDNSRNLYYTRPSGGNFKPNDDVSDYDLCNFFIATQGGSLLPGTIIGSLYIHYDIEFTKEHVFGGIPQLGQLYSAFHTVLTPIVAFNWDDLMVNRVGGYDLGITARSNTVIFPASLAGATVRMLATLRCRGVGDSIPATAVSLTNATYNQCVQATPATNSLIQLPVLATGTMSQALCIPGSAVTVCEWENCIKIDDVVSTSEISIIYTNTPIVLNIWGPAAGDLEYGLVFEVLPRDYMSLI